MPKNVVHEGMKAWWYAKAKTSRCNRRTAIEIRLQKNEVREKAYRIRVPFSSDFPVQAFCCNPPVVVKMCNLRSSEFDPQGDSLGEDVGEG